MDVASTIIIESSLHRCGGFELMVKA